MAKNDRKLGQVNNQGLGPASAAGQTQQPGPTPNPSKEKNHELPQDKKKDNPTEHPKRESSMRWWEFYAVRYAMGTVVGAIVFFLFAQQNKVLKPILLGVGDQPTLDATSLILLVSFGLVYCYIASAPILVLHAGRFLLKLEAGWWKTWRWRDLYLAVPPLATVATYFFLPTGVTSSKALVATGVFAFTLVFWTEAVVVFKTLRDTTKLIQFYQNLWKRRSAASGEEMESYKHLREHGNSFFILFLELVLAIVLFGAASLNLEPLGIGGTVQGNWQLPLLVLGLWISPAALVWLIGTLFERAFSESSI